MVLLVDSAIRLRWRSTAATPPGSSTSSPRPGRRWRRCDRVRNAPSPSAARESTNDVARELAEAEAPSGTVVTADEQTAGRGRRGRVWSAPPREALLYSAILRPLELEHVLLPLSVPIAVCEAVESVAGVEARIKWPNDVWLDEAKVAGS